MTTDRNTVPCFFSSLFEEFTIGQSVKLLIKQKKGIGYEKFYWSIDFSSHVSGSV